jgi:pseudouridine kinase
LFDFGGVSGNVVQNLALLGVQPHFLTVFSTDVLGQSAETFYQSNNIDTTHSLKTTHANPTYLSLLNQNNDLFIGVNDMGALKALDKAYLRKHKAYINSFDTLFIDTNLSTESLEWLLKSTNTNHTVIDAVSALKVTKLKAFLPHIDMLKCTTSELSMLSNKTTVNDQCKELIKSGVSSLIVTNKGNEIRYQTKHDTHFFMPQPIQHIVSSSGAGDAFISGFIYGLLTDTSIKQAMQYAIAAANQTLQVQSSVNQALQLGR